MLERLGRFCARRHWQAIVVWIVVVVAVGVFAQYHHGDSEDVFTVPGTQSQEALDLLEASFPSAAGTSVTVVWEAQTGTLQDSATQAAINRSVDALRAMSGVSSVSSPFEPAPTGIDVTDGQVQLETTPLNINKSGTVGFSVVQFDHGLTSLEQAEELFSAAQQAAEPAVDAGVVVNYGGPVVDMANAPDPGISQYSELIGIIFAVVILLVALGSATSMAVPIVIALIAVFTSHNIVSILESSFTIGSVAPILGSMIGLGVGIDYSLFIVSRFRQNLKDGMTVPDAVGKAIATSGSAVLFAGITVCIALCALYFVQIPYVAQLGYIAALFVAVTILTTLTLVPAVLGALGQRINSGRIHRRDETQDIHKTLSARWAATTSRHPVRYAVMSLMVLLVLALPLRSMHLGFTDAGDLSSELTQHQAFEALTENFGPGENGPLVIAVALPEITEANAVGILESFDKLNTAVAATSGVARVSLPVPNNFPSEAHPDAMPTAAIVQVVPTTAPNADETAELVERLRNDVIPTALAGGAISASSVYVGGQTAILIDLSDALSSRLFLFIGVVVLGAFLLLMMVFRSVFVPFKAALMNLLSIGSAYGVIIAVFQWGWLKDLVGLDTTVPIVAFVPVMMFAVLFGLSMDYEVFLIARIKEEYNKTGDSRQSVVTGLAATARVITAAALIMIAVFVSFVPNPDPTVKMIGLGLAVSVLIDATVVRMMLVPSTMELAGRANWWIPRWLDRILPRIHVE